MQVIGPHDRHKNARRSLTAWKNDLQVNDFKHMIVAQDGVRLGGHKHPFEEKFILAQGRVKVETWSIADGRRTQFLEAPQLAIFAPHEEHALTCSADTVIIVFLAEEFSQENIIPAENL